MSQNNAGAGSVVLLVGVGDLGARIGDRLVDHNHHVLGLRRSAADVPDRFDALGADVTDVSSLRSAAVRLEQTQLNDKSLTVVFTVTAGERNEAAYQRVYVGGMENVVEVLQPKRIVSVSSTAVYDTDDGSWVDESTSVDPSGFSGRAMVQMEQVAAQSDAEASTVRLGGVYGPGRTRFLEQVRNGLATFGEQPTYTNRIHVEDAATLVALVTQHEAPPPVVLGVDDEPASRRDVIEWLAAQLGVEAPPIDTDFSPGANKRCRNQLARSLGFDPMYPTFREGYGSLLP